MKGLSTRTAGFTDSVIRRMTRISLKYGAVNLSQGFPDFDPPKEITNRLAEVAGIGPHQYALTWGAQNFREALARKQEHFSGMKVDPDQEIVVTCGSTEAMMAAMMSVCNPGDKVVIFSPFYENYGADTILSGAEPVYVPLKPPAFEFDSDELEAAIAFLGFVNGMQSLQNLILVGNEHAYIIEDNIDLTLAHIHEFYDADASAELVQPLSSSTGLSIYRILD